MPLVGQLSCMVRCRISDACHQAGYPLTPEQTSAFMVLHHFDSLSQSMLAHILDKDKASVSRLINSLVQSGLVDRVQDEQDRRVVRVVINAKGKQAFEDIYPAIKQISATTLQGVSEEELSLVEQSLQLMIENLTDDKCQHRD